MTTADDNLSKVSTTITFGLTCAEESAASLKLELDATLNSDLSVFVPGTKAFIRVFPANIAPTYGWTQGDLVVENTNISFTPEKEDIVFTKSKSGSLSYWVDTIISWEWIGNVLHCVTPPIPIFTKDQVTVPENISGILRVEYTSKYDSISIMCSSAMKVLVEAEKEDPSLVLPGQTEAMYGYIVVDFEGEGATRVVTLTVKDACTRTVIPNARVYLNEVDKGLTDALGRIALGELIKGQRYALRVTAEGYQATNDDAIANDFIEVQ